MNLEKRLTDKKNWLTYENITPRELRESNYPDDTLQLVKINLTSKAGNNYEVFWQYSPYFTLSTDKTNYNDLMDVSEIVANELWVKPPKEAISHPKEIFTIIPAPEERLTQGGFYWIIEDTFIPNFKDVWISKLAYWNITREQFEKSTLPKFKIVEIQREKVESDFFRIYENDINYFLENPNKVTYNDVKCKFKPDEIYKRQIPDIKLDLGILKFYGPDNRKYDIWLQPWKGKRYANFRILISGSKRFISGLVELVLNVTKGWYPIDNLPVLGDKDSVPVFLRKGGRGEVRQENILDLEKYLSKFLCHDFSCSVTYNNLTKEEFDTVAHKADLSKVYTVVNNRKLPLEKFIGDVKAESLLGFCTNPNTFKYYFEFVNQKKKQELLELVIKNKKKVNPEVVDWVNDTQRNLVEDIAVAGVGEK